MTYELFCGLPPYEGGVLSPEIYNAGGGFYDDRVPPKVGDEAFPRRFMGDKPIPREFFEMFVQRAKKRGDGVEVSETENGVSAVIERKDGTVRFDWKNDETMSAVYLSVRERIAFPDKKTLMRTVTETSAEEFSKYIAALNGEGFCTVFENGTENNLYYQLRKGDRLIYAYYMGNTATARIIDDVASTDVSEFGYKYTPEKGDFPAVIQYGLYHSPDSRVDGVRSDCGMFYMIKLADNSMFLIDGAAMEECTDVTTDDVMRLMRWLTGVPKGEKIRIAGWFCTHAHGDHITLFSKLIRFHHDELDLERMIYNFTSPDVFSAMSPAYELMDRVNAYYTGVKYLKCHSGQSFELGGVKFDIFQTHEDGTGVVGNEVIGGFNDTSTIMKITFDGKTFMVLGDMDVSAEKVILDHYSFRSLKSDMVQTAHHLMNHLERMYVAIAPTYALVPQHPVFRFDHNHYKYETLCKSVFEKNIYFGANGTVGFRVKDGELHRFLYYPVVGGEYDGSQV